MQKNDYELQETLVRDCQQLYWYPWNNLLLLEFI
jgi:hypothetical protein